MTVNVAEEFESTFLKGKPQNELKVGLAVEVDPGTWELHDLRTCSASSLAETLIALGSSVAEDVQLVRVGFRDFVPGSDTIASVSLSKYGDQLILDFSDQSHVGLPVSDPGRWHGAAERSGPVDVGPALFEPVTSREFAGVEPIMGVLWDALDTDGLSESQRYQIIAMAELLKAQQAETSPGQTPRWQVVATVRSALRYLARELPRDALAWWKLAELLSAIDWSTVASELPSV